MKLTQRQQGYLTRIHEAGEMTDPGFHRTSITSLLNKGLVDTRYRERKVYYYLTQQGKEVLREALQ